MININNDNENIKFLFIKVVKNVDNENEIFIIFIIAN